MTMEETMDETEDEVSSYSSSSSWGSSNEPNVPASFSRLRDCELQLLLQPSHLQSKESRAVVPSSHNARSNPYDYHLQFDFVNAVRTNQSELTSSAQRLALMDESSRHFDP